MKRVLVAILAILVTGLVPAIARADGATVLNYSYDLTMPVDAGTFTCLPNSETYTGSLEMQGHVHIVYRDGEVVRDVSQVTYHGSLTGDVSGNRYIVNDTSTTNEGSHASGPGPVEWTQVSNYRAVGTGPDTVSFYVHVNTHYVLQDDGTLVGTVDHINADCNQ